MRENELNREIAQLLGITTWHNPEADEPDREPLWYFLLDGEWLGDVFAPDVEQAWERVWTDELGLPDWEHSVGHAFTLLSTLVPSFTVSVDLHDDGDGKPFGDQYPNRRGSAVTVSVGVGGDVIGATDATFNRAAAYAAAQMALHILAKRMTA